MTKLITFLIEPHRVRAVDILKRPFRNALCYGALMDEEARRTTRMAAWINLIILLVFGINFYGEIVEGESLISALATLFFIFLFVFGFVVTITMLYGHRNADKVPAPQHYSTQSDLKSLAFAAGFGAGAIMGITALIEFIFGG